MAYAPPQARHLPHRHRDRRGRGRVLQVRPRGGDQDQLRGSLGGGHRRAAHGNPGAQEPHAGGLGDIPLVDMSRNTRCPHGDWLHLELGANTTVPCIVWGRNVLFSVITD